MQNKVYRTVIEPKKNDFKINHKSKLLFIGSCFTENIGYYLKKLKFDIDINPFGILYNPISVYYALNFIKEKRIFEKNDLFFYNERWNSYYHHGRFSLNDVQQTLDIINKRINAAHNRLHDLDYIFISFGTSWVYKLNETGEVVSNCHKVPTGEFTKELLKTNRISDVYSEIIKKLQKFNEKLKIIYTISPVRHLKDGFEENFLSKSILRTAVQKLTDNFEHCFYFPSYEIVTDDLRDYRFYNSDMLHPSQEAIEYIFNYFSSTYFNEDTFSLNKQILKILNAKEHRPFNPGSKQFADFKNKISEKIKILKSKYPYINFDEETQIFK